MLSFTLFLVAMAGLVLSKKLLDDYFTPPAIYNFFWAFALGALELGWVSFDPLRSQAWQAITLGYAGFLCGCLVVALHSFTRPDRLVARPCFERTDRQKLEKALLIMFLLGVTGFLVQLVHLQSQMGLTTFLTSPREAREMYTNVKYIGFFNILNVANFVLALAYLVLYRKPQKWVVLILLWALATTFLTTDRTRFFYMVIWSFYLVVYLYRRVSFSPRLVLGGAVTLFALFAFFVLIAKFYKKEAFEDNMEFVNVPQEYAVVVDPYIYLTGSFPVFQAFLDDKQELTFGKYSFGPIVKLIELIYPEFERENLVGKFYRVPIELNAATYLEPFYRDFGVFGILIGPFILGLVSMGAYIAMRQRKTLFSVFLASLLSFCTTITIFINHFTQIATWFFVLVGYAVYRYTRSSEPTDPPEFRPKIYP